MGEHRAKAQRTPGRSHGTNLTQRSTTNPGVNEQFESNLCCWRCFRQWIRIVKLGNRREQDQRRVWVIEERSDQSQIFQIFVKQLAWC